MKFPFRFGVAVGCLTRAGVMFALVLAPLARGKEVGVGTTEALSRALHAAKPGDRIVLAPGTYRGGVHISGISGTADAPVVIEAADPRRPPLFSAEKGGRSGFHLSGCSQIHLRNLHVRGFAINGINLDDGGQAASPAVGIALEGLLIEDIGPRGNHDALKLSGLKNFSVTGCRFVGWGGSGIDLVGCHDGVIDGCRFEGKPGFSQANGVQAKGGSSGIRILRSFFHEAGQRAINLGGGTGLPYFRPDDATWEARNLEVAGNLFAGSLAPIAWVGIDGGHVHHNTIHLPEKWVARILQENTDPRFGRCRGGVFEHNLIVFDRRVRTFVNVGPHTDPASFIFRHNAWFAADDPGRSPGPLPVEESRSITGIDPELAFDPVRGELAIRNPDPRLREVGAGAYHPED